MALIESKFSRSKLSEDKTKMTVDNFDKEKFEEEEEKDVKPTINSMLVEKMNNITYTDLVEESNKTDD
jgi:hypothetical protein